MQPGYRVEKFATGLRVGCGIFAETNSAILWKKNISPDMSMNTSMNIRANAVTPMPSTTTTIMKNTTTGTETPTITETTGTITIIMERVAIGW